MGQSILAQTKLGQSGAPGLVFLPAWTQACPSATPDWQAQKTRQADIKKCQEHT